MAQNDKPLIELRPIAYKIGFIWLFLISFPASHLIVTVLFRDWDQSAKQFILLILYLILLSATIHISADLYNQVKNIHSKKGEQ